MASCPLTGVRSAEVLLCEKYESWTVCMGCPALILVTFMCWPGGDFQAFLTWARKAFEREGMEGRVAEAMLRAISAVDPDAAN